MIVVNLAQQSDELLHAVVLQLTLTERGLLDEELDVGLLLLLVDALVAVRCQSGSSRSEGSLIEFRCGDDAIGHLYGRHVALFVADAGVEGQQHVSPVAVGIGEVGLHRVVASHLIHNSLTVASHVLTLEGGAATLHGHTVGIAQFWYDGHHGLLLHILLWEVAIDGCGYCTSLSLKRIRGHGEVVG